MKNYHQQVLRRQDDLRGHRPGRDGGYAAATGAGIIGGIASGGHLVRPHVVDPAISCPRDFQQAIEDSFPGTGDSDVPLDPDTWTIITDGMADVTTTGTSCGLRTWKALTLPARPAPPRWWAAGDTAHQRRRHDSELWFVGVVPRRNPEIGGCRSTGSMATAARYPARIGAEIVTAYVNKKRSAGAQLSSIKPAVQQTG